MKILFNISFYVAFIGVLLSLAGGLLALTSGNDVGVFIGIGAIAYSLALLMGLTFMRLVERHLCKIEKSVRHPLTRIG